MAPRRAEPYVQAEPLRMALEELGTTIIKLAQFLSIRADILPAAFQQELAKLQDSASGSPIEDAEVDFQRQFGAVPSELNESLGRIERLIDRLIPSTLVAALIIGMAALLAVYRPPGWDELAGIVFALGMFVAIVLGLYLTWTILRSGGC